LLLPVCYTYVSLQHAVETPYNYQAILSYKARIDTLASARKMNHCLLADGEHKNTCTTSSMLTQHAGRQQQVQ
jgi:hypothetical protein